MGACGLLGSPTGQVATAPQGLFLLPSLAWCPPCRGRIVQLVHTLGPTSQLAKTRPSLLAVGYFESTKNDLGEGRIAQEKHYYSIIFFLKCKQLNLEKQNQF